MDDEGWYYLHENGDLIFKRHRPEQESGGFVRRVWRFVARDRESAWNQEAVEAISLLAQGKVSNVLLGHIPLPAVGAVHGCEGGGWGIVDLCGSTGPVPDDEPAPFAVE